jgi:hypothetical protein
MIYEDCSAFPPTGVFRFGNSLTKLVDLGGELSVRVGLESQGQGPILEPSGPKP